METFNPFRFEGRVGRLQYFGYSVVWGLVVTVMAALLTAGDPVNGPSAGGSISLFLVLIVYTVATLSYGVRRLHDLDKSGWWMLLSIVPFANLVLGLILLLGPGTPGPNRYGVRDEHVAITRSA